MTDSNPTSNRFIAVEGVANLRDMGGLPLPDGRRVKPGLLYRSADLHRLAANDTAGLHALRLKTLVDFRSPEESGSHPNQLPPDIRVYEIPILAGDVIRLSGMDAERGPETMRRIYQYFVCDAQAAYRGFFRILQDAGSLPLLFHCSAGKDRTGYAAALFLAAVGAEWKVILADYLASAGPVEAKYAELLAKYPELKPLFAVQESYLEAAFHCMDTQFGGAQAYLQDVLQVDLARMRALYTDAV